MNLFLNDEKVSKSSKDDKTLTSMKFILFLLTIYVGKVRRWINAILAKITRNSVGIIISKIVLNSE